MLIAFGAESHPTLRPFTAAEAEAEATQWRGWQPILDALRKIEAGAAPAPVAQTPVAPAPVPAVSVAAGAGVTEGAPARFTLMANPAPAADLGVSLALTRRGDVADASALGTRTVTIPAGAATAAFTVATVDDAADEQDGAVVATVKTGAGYTVGNAGPHRWRSPTMTRRWSSTAS